MTRESRMLQYFRSRGRNVDGLEKLINKFDCKIEKVTKMEITLEQMIKEVEDELKDRKTNYTIEVKNGNMKPETARYKYDCMQAILDNLKGQRDGH